MNIIGQMSYGNNLFSFDKVDESSLGRNRLSEFLRFRFQHSQCVICLCERPLFNESVRELIRPKSSVLSRIVDVQHDDFSLSFSETKGRFENEVIDLLSDCFYFFQHPAFVFLKNEADIASCKTFCKKNSYWGKITDNYDCCFVYKAVEDDVVWYKVSCIES